MKYEGYYFKIRTAPIFGDTFLKYFSDVEGNRKSEALDIKNFFGLHAEVRDKCVNLFQSGNHAEAVEKSFKIVKDRLRILTGYESGSDAFGRGRLYIKGASAANVDLDFNKAVQYLTMAIDMFRNEKVHTSDAKIDDPVRAYQYLVMSSLALCLLENSEIRDRR